ncbi:MAG TPA: caspase family protein [Halioglobus sp.]
MASRALLIGIDTYPDPRNNLNSCVADTLAFRQMLLGTYKFRSDQIRLLHNRDATKSNVLGELQWLLTGAQDGDRLVFFDSSHGYRYPDGDTMVEVLCLYDQFLADTEFVAITASAPSRALTAVLDCCHAGGMNKFFFPQGNVEVARAKVWRPAAAEEEINLQLYAQVTKFKFFGQAATSDSGAVAKNFQMNPVGIPAPKDASEGGSEFNGAIFAACQADQTAAAGSASTKNLSAFTFALLEELDSTLPLSDLRTRVADRLNALNMSQEPRAIAPTLHQELLTEAFLAGVDSDHGSTSSTSPAADTFDPFEYLRSQLGDLFKQSQSKKES